MKKFNVSAIFSTVDKITKPVKKISQGITGLGKSVDKTNSKLKRTNRISPFKRLSFGARNFGGNLTSLSGSISGVSGALSGMLGLAVGGGLLGMGKAALSNADALGKMSNRVGISVEDLSLISFAAERAGLAQKGFNSSIRRFSKRLVDAKADTGQAKKAYAELGFTLDGLRKLKTDEVFKKVSESLSLIKDDSKRARLAQRLFGDEGVKMSTLLKNGYAGLNKEMELGRQSGALITRKEADDAAKFNDSVQEMSTNISGVFKSLAFELLPEIKSFVTTSINWIRENKDLVKTILKVTASLGGLVASLTFISMSVTGIMAVGNAIGFVGTVIKGIMLFMKGNPLFLALSLLATAAFMIRKNWEPISQFFKNLWGGITDVFDLSMKKMEFGFVKISNMFNKVKGVLGLGKEMEFPESREINSNSNILSKQHIQSKNQIDVNINDTRTTVNTSTPEEKATRSYINVGQNNMGALNAF